MKQILLIDHAASDREYGQHPHLVLFLLPFSWNLWQEVYALVSKSRKRELRRYGFSTGTFLEKHCFRSSEGDIQRPILEARRWNRSK
jgi:hypothetical protein